MSDDITTLLIRIQGSVQGVGFRAFATREANARQLNGWVRNRLDGTVEVLASGPTKRVEDFITACIHGPEGARVANVDLLASGAPEHPGFMLLPTV